MPQPTVIQIRLSAADGPKLALPDLAKGDFYRFHAMVKPSGSQCNLDCAYCFYLHKEDLLQQPKKARMTRLPAGAAHPAVHRDAHRWGSGVFLAGWRAHADGAGVFSARRRATGAL